MDRYRTCARVIASTLILASIGAFLACSSQEKRALKAVQEHLKNQGYRDMQVDLFHSTDKAPSQAYIAITATHNFATGDGSFQKEYLGYVLKRDGLGWSVDRNVSYTKDTAHAETILSGGK